MNPQLIQLLLAALGMQRQGGTPALARAASQGRGGDTMLAHINPREAEMLKDAGGSGTINPRTGLPEFYDGAPGGDGAPGAPAPDTGTGLGAANSGSLGGFGFGGINALSNPTTGFDPIDTMPSPTHDAPTSGEKLGGMLGSLGLTSIANAIAPGLGVGLGLTSGASGLTGGPTLSGSLAQALADLFGGIPQPASMTNQGGINIGAPSVNVAPAGASNGPDLYPFGIGQSGAGTNASAIDPALQSAMLYARG